jgi:hypothetical protein
LFKTFTYSEEKYQKLDDGFWQGKYEDRTTRSSGIDREPEQRPANLPDHMA